MMLSRVKLIASVVIIALAFGVGWTANGWRLNNKHNAEKAEANADYAALALKRWQDQTKMQELTDELAKRNAQEAHQEARTREQVAAAVAKYQATHNTAPAAACGTVLGADWMRVFDSSTGSAAVPAPAASRSADPLSTALALSAHNNAAAVSCQRKLQAWQDWYSGIKKAR